MLFNASPEIPRGLRITNTILAALVVSTDSPSSEAFQFRPRVITFPFCVAVSFNRRWRRGDNIYNKPSGRLPRHYIPLTRRGQAGKIKLLAEFNLVLVEGSGENSPSGSAFLFCSETE